jgi:hypothetical protein
LILPPSSSFISPSILTLLISFHFFLHFFATTLLFFLFFFHLLVCFYCYYLTPWTPWQISMDKMKFHTLTCNTRMWATKYEFIVWVNPIIPTHPLSFLHLDNIYWISWKKKKMKKKWRRRRGNVFKRRKKRSQPKKNPCKTIKSPKKMI